MPYGRKLRPYTFMIVSRQKTKFKTRKQNRFQVGARLRVALRLALTPFPKITYIHGLKFLKLILILNA